MKSTKSKLLGLLLLALLGFTGGVAAFGDFCDGFEDGYITGYKQGANTSYDPYTPYCPYQPYKKYSDSESDYEHGYTIGYRCGLVKGRARREGSVLSGGCSDYR